MLFRLPLLANNTIQLVHWNFILNIYVPFWVISTSSKHAHAVQLGGLTFNAMISDLAVRKEVCERSDRATENAKFLLF